MEYWWGGRRRPLGFINARPPRLWFFFSGVTSESLAHIKQTAAGFTWKPPEANALTPGLIGMFLPPQMSPPKKEEAPSWFSHCKSGWAESACCKFSSSFPPPISSRSLCFFFSPTLSVSFFSLPPLDQCPLCHQEMYKPSLSTPPRCVSPGAPRALSLSMESTRDIRWARRRSVSWCTLVVGGRPARSRYRSHSDFSSDGMCFSVVFKHVSSFLCHFWLRGRS